MPNEGGGKSVEQQPEEHDPAAQSVIPPVQPNDPSRAAAQTVSEQEEKRDIQKIEDRVKRAEKWMIWLTAAIAFSGLCAVIVGVLQWRVMSGQLGEMKSGGIDSHALAIAAGKQADAASDMATAAGDQVEAANNFADTAEDINKGIAGAAKQLQASAENSKQWTKTVQASMRLDQRAWLSATITSQTITISQPITANLRLQNVGRTPAIRISGLMKMEAVPQGKRPTFIYKQKIIKDEPTVGDFNLATMLPNAQANLRVPAAVGVENGKQVGEIMLDQPHADALAAGTVTLYLHGEINYCDVFKVRHWVKFCFVYEPDPMQQVSTPDGNRFIACRQHNETDDESDKQETCPAPKAN